MDSSSGSQFEQLVDDASAHVRAHLCEGDPSTAVLWDDPTGITVRLSLLGDEIWLFAGSGVGKSVLLGMMARYTQADVIVVGLIGEREIGRAHV